MQATKNPVGQKLSRQLAEHHRKKELDELVEHMLEAEAEAEAEGEVHKRSKGVHVSVICSYM